MKRFVLTLLVAGALGATGLQAAGYGSCDPCCNPCPSWCCGSFEVGAQWIYLRPTSCDYDFVIKDVRQVNPSTNQSDVDAILAWLPQGKSHGIDADYESGFRVSVGYIMDCSCYDVRVEYTYHHPCDRSTVCGSETCGLWPTYMHPRYARNVTDTSGNGGNPAFETPIFSGMINSVPIEAKAHSRVKLDYDAVDLQLGSRCCKSCCLWLRTYAGLHFMNLDHKQTACYHGVMFGQVDDEKGIGSFTSVCGEFITDVRWHKNTWGIGPLFGIDARYEIACNFGIAGHFGAAILAGETDGKFFEHDIRNWFGSGPPTDVDQIADVKHDHRNLLFPYLRASLGVNYLWCCGDCFNVLVEVGYEFNSYINAIGHFRFNDERATGMANCYSYNLDGIYVSVRATI